MFLFSMESLVKRLVKLEVVLSKIPKVDELMPSYAQLTDYLERHGEQVEAVTR